MPQRGRVGLYSQTRLSRCNGVSGPTQMDSWHSEIWSFELAFKLKDVVRELAQLGTWKRPQCTGGGTELTPTLVASGTERHVGHLECSREGAPQSLFSISVERGWELASLRLFRQEQKEVHQGDWPIGSVEVLVVWAQ